MSARRIATAAAMLLTGLGLGTFAHPPVEGRRAEPAAVAQVSRAGGRSAVTARDTQAGTRTEVRNVPAAFRLPPGSKVADLDDQESGASFTLTAPAPADVLSFYRGWLPSSPLTVVAEAGPSLAFRDERGWAGTIYATEHRVTVAVKRA